MAESPIPDDVKKLIGSHIVSVEQLEILLLLFRSPGEDWSARRVSQEIRTSSSSAFDRLQDLSERGFLAVQEGPEPTFRFAPRDALQTAAVANLAAVYGQRRYSVINLIFDKPVDKLRRYADAFRLGKDDSDA